MHSIFATQIFEHILGRCLVLTHRNVSGLSVMQVVTTVDCCQEVCMMNWFAASCLHSDLLMPAFAFSCKWALMTQYVIDALMSSIRSDGELVYMPREHPFS